MPFGLHWPEIILILVIVLIVFGVGKLPQIGGAVGKSINEFRKARSGETTDNKEKDVAKSNEADAAAKS
jgi:sec-independent protein translocase protein TatA